MASLTGIKKDDIVRIDVRGQRFWVLVTEGLHMDPVRKKKGITVRSMTHSRGLPASFVTGFQVVGHWRKSKATQLDF